MFALVDCNNFYASCERVFNPALQHQPVAILSNNDGCVISRSDEAKVLGLPMGAPFFKWKAFCKEHNISVLSSNYPLYGDMSARVMKILEGYTPDVEVYSIDEAFLQFKGFDHSNFDRYGAHIKQRILKWTGIPTCVGIAPTKSLCKIANKIARKNPEKTGGVFVIDSEKTRVWALKNTKIEHVWGIGFRLQKRLKTVGCKTAWDFTMLSDEWVRGSFSITEWRLKKDLEGTSKIALELRAPKRSIATTRSFDYAYDDLSYIKERIATFAASCAEKLRAQKSSCHMIIVSISSDHHKKNLQRHHGSKTVVFSSPTNSSLLISKAAVTAISQVFKPGIRYKRAGVVVTGLVPTEHHQLNLFSKEDPKHQFLMKTIDALNKKYKSDTIKIARQDLERTWKMRQERLSPRYTTRLSEIIQVK